MVSPQTLLRWHRESMKGKWTYKRISAGGRPPFGEEVRDLKGARMRIRLLTGHLYHRGPSQTCCVELHQPVATGSATLQQPCQQPHASERERGRDCRWGGRCLYTHTPSSSEEFQTVRELHGCRRMNTQWLVARCMSTVNPEHLTSTYRLNVGSTTQRSRPNSRLIRANDLFVLDTDRGEVEDLFTGIL